MNIHLLSILLFSTPIITEGQILLKGRVMDSKSDTPLGGATIYNLSQHIYKKAAFDGKFSIIAMEKDKIIFSSTSYRSDTIEVSEDLLINGFEIGLKALPVVLDTVLVTSRSYTADSMERRNEYRHFYSQNIQNITGGNTPEHGFGITISPFSYLSRKERAKRRFRKQLEYIEQQAYIDYYFSPPIVHRITGLTGQELQTFMLKYRPSYRFVRSAGTEDLFRYINQSFKEFKKDPSKVSKNR